MTFDNFKKAVLHALTDYYGEDYTLTIRPIPKNNQVVLDGLTIQKGDCNISPTIYLNPYYEKFQEGTPLFSILEEMKNLYAVNRPAQNIDIRFFTDFENVKDRICMKLIHYENNRELLQEVPHIRFLDLAVVFYYLIHVTPGENATILIHNSHLDYWDASPELLYQLATENTPQLLPYYLDDIFSILTELNDLSCYEKERTTPLYVLTNSEKLFGAASILYPGLLSEIAARMDKDFIILPSSIHEVLLIPVPDSSDRSDYSSIIEEVNLSQLTPEEVLSCHAYYFSRKTNLIT